MGVTLDVSQPPHRGQRQRARRTHLWVTLWTCPNRRILVEGSGREEPLYGCRFGRVPAADILVEGSGRE